MIHPTAIIHQNAKVDPTVIVGPYSVIDGGVELGPDCILGPHVYLTGLTLVGTGNQFHAGCVIGDIPQDLKYEGERTVLRIGEKNVFRERVTVHRACEPGGETVIGSHNFLMANSHVGHNCILGDKVILANGVLLAGHVTVGSRAFLSGNCLVHQNMRVGTLSLMQGGAAISQDLPPYTIARGANQICGLNMEGLRRAGFTEAEKLELKQVYRLLFRSHVNLRLAVVRGRDQFKGEAATVLLDFVASASRGVCTHPD